MKILMTSHFFSDEMGFLSVNLNTINLNNINLDEDDPENIIHARFLNWCNTFKQRKSFKKHISKELKPVAWHPTRLWD